MNSEFDLERSAISTQIFSKSNSITEFCRNLVHDAILGKGLLGAQVHVLTNRGNLISVGSYGLESYSGDEAIEMFGDNPVAISVREKRLWHGAHPENKAKNLWSMPLLRDQLPTGSISMVADPAITIEPMGESAVQIIANSGNQFLDTLGIKKLIQDPSDVGNGDLTDRQYEVLLLMTKGLTNQAIADQLILSESSIKQESVKIFKALGVGTRQQAVSKARATGLISANLLED